MGRNCVREVLATSPERIVEVYTCSKEDDLLNALQRKKIPIKFKGKNELTSMVNSDSHQSFVAAVKERGHQTLKEFLDNPLSKSIVVMLDSIYDPQNMGTIFRAGECFGVDAVVYSKNRGTDVTPVVTKTSSGATEHVTIIKVSNLAESVRQFQEAGYEVITAEAGKSSVSLYDFQFPEKSLIIMGSEGEGVQPILSKNADHKVMIPMLGTIDSLNVSQASAVILAFYRRQHS